MVILVLSIADEGPITGFCNGLPALDLGADLGEPLGLQ